VSEGEVAHLGDSSPGLREAEGEGDEDFYIARSGKSTDLYHREKCIDKLPTQWSVQLQKNRARRLDGSNRMLSLGNVWM
jgi:hypothetical protein